MSAIISPSFLANIHACILFACNSLYHRNFSPCHVCFADPMAGIGAVAALTASSSIVSASSLRRVVDRRDKDVNDRSHWSSGVLMLFQS